MKHIFGLILISVFLFSCGKDKFTTVPQIKFKSIKPNSYRSGTLNTDPQSPPILSIQLTDAEGDFGFSLKDTSYVYIKNLTISPFNIDSIRFPSNLVRKSNLNATVEVNLATASRLLGNSGSLPRPYTDTVFFEVYVQDFAKNKSNVIKTSEPLYIRTL